MLQLAICINLICRLKYGKCLLKVLSLFPHGLTYFNQDPVSLDFLGFF